MNIDAIFFDLGMVLVTFDWDIAIPRFAARNGRNEKIIKDFLAHPKHESFERNGVSGDAFYAFGRDSIKWRGSQQEFQQIWNEIFTEIPEAIRLARALAQEYPLHVISNTNPWHAAYVEAKYEWINLFEQRIYSCAVELRKPDPRIYQLAAERAGVPPERALFIDDRLENLEGAQKIGMQTIHAPTTQLLRAGLEKYFPHLAKIANAEIVKERT